MAEHSAPSGAPGQRWSVIGWRFSAILVIAVLGIAGTITYRQLVAARELRGTVVDDYTGKPIAGASVVAGLSHSVTDSRGAFHVSPDVTTIRVAATGYDATALTLSSDTAPLAIRLRPNFVRGIVLNGTTHQPVPDATVAVRGADATAVKTDGAGRYLLTGVPPDATLTVEAAGFAGSFVDPGTREQLDVDLRPDVLSGTVRDPQGDPVAGALVALGSATTTTGSDGRYRLDGVPATGTVVFKAPGFQVATAPLESSMRLDATLHEFTVRAIYADPAMVAQPSALNSLEELIARTELNAVVIDVKDGTGQVYYDTSVPLAQQIGAVHPAFDPRQLIATLHQRGIYVIARIAVFDDPILAAQRPDWAIHTAGGAVWLGWNGRPWLNPYRREVWDYDTALATEASRLGFDEVQLDAVQFPTDGLLDQVDYGAANSAVAREAAIRGFLTQVHAALASTTTSLSTDVSEQALWELGGGGLGQRLEDIAGAVDYVCPTLYPADFPSGTLGYAVPNDHPFEVVLWSLQAGAGRIPGDAAKLRPWLQDFSQGPGMSYGDNEVRREIQGAEDSGASGWMLWNPASDYHSGALQPT